MPLTVALVHGAWANGSCWNKVIPLLEASGVDVVAVHNPLPSAAPTDQRMATCRGLRTGGYEADRDGPSAPPIRGAQGWARGPEERKSSSSASDQPFSQARWSAESGL